MPRGLGPGTGPGLASVQPRYTIAPAEPRQAHAQVRACIHAVATSPEQSTGPTETLLSLAFSHNPVKLWLMHDSRLRWRGPGCHLTEAQVGSTDLQQAGALISPDSSLHRLG